MKQNKLDKKLKLKYILQIILFLRKNSVDGLYVTQTDIMESLLIVRSQASNSLKVLGESNLISIKTINTTRNKGPRKMYKLNKNGRKMADKILARGLNKEEKNLLNINKRIYNTKNTKIQKDLRTIIQLFQEYGPHESNSLLSEMSRNFVKQVKKVFRYKTQFNQESILEANTVKREA